jgi:hypothetical protein
MALNFNAAPYYDNFDETKEFYKILFKPGYAVQTRELNQLQSIIQKQIEVTGKWLFKDGAMILGGTTSIDTKAQYVIFPLGTNVSLLKGLVLTGSDSGVTAQVIHTEAAAGEDLPTIFVKYTNSGSDTETKTFDNGEILLDADDNEVGTTKSTNATGTGSIASVESGFFFIKNAFVYVPSQTIVLDKYSNAPSYKIGLDATESFISSDEDDTLLDNAQGSFNYAAPGADRYAISLDLVKKNPDDTSVEENFIQLKIVKDGVIIRSIENTANSILEKTLARRTFDESGDYTVKPFLIDIREYRNNFRGDWTAYEYYLAGDVVTSGGNFYRCREDGQANNTAPTVTVGSHTIVQTGVIWTYESNPFYNRGITDVVLGESLVTQRANADKLAIGLEPGKAYVGGYEIDKQATEFIPIQKSRDYLQQSNIKIPATVGNYIIVNNVNSLPDISSFPTVTLYNQLTASVGVSAGTAVGTARIRMVEFNNDTTPGTSATKYKVSLFNVTMNTGYNFNRDVKQLFISGGSTATSFSADIFSVLTNLTGSISVSSTTVTGTGTLFATELKVGDYISVTIGGTEYRRRVTVITSNTTVTIGATIGTTVTGEKFSRVQTNIVQPEYEALLFVAPKAFVKTVRDAEGDNNTSYTATKRFVKNSVDAGSTGTITLNVSGTDTFASSDDADNYLVLDNTTGAIVVPNSIVGGTTQEVVITVAQDAVREYIVFAAINRTGASTEKTKTLTTTNVTITAKTSATTPIIKLGKADGFRLLQVVMDTGTFTSPTGTYTTDITSRYYFDKGQKVTHYDLCSIVLAPGETPPTAPIKVYFEYFTHSGSGDHFTVDSYTSTISYDEIPFFQDVPLAWLYDFRPRINDAGTGFDSAVLMPKRGIDIESDFQHYLSRNDKVVLNQSGTFFVTSGTPAIDPAEAINTSVGMVLYKLNLSPYNYTTGSVQIETIDNKRYTMRDIGKLEKRIDNIEYYTALSLLEQDAQSLEIQDEDGLNRFKNGFIVDNFTGTNIGDNSSIDYQCAIDMENGHMRPRFYMDNVNLIEQNTADSERTTDGYKVTGDLVTLPYTEVELVKQLDASRVENINPFAIFTFIGQAQLTPASDEWFETKRLPDIHVNAEGNFNSVYSALEASGSLSGIWNAWQTQWTGKPNVTKNTFDARLSGNGAQKTAQKAAFNALFAQRPGDNDGVLRTVVTETTATQIGLSRTGVRSVITPRVDTTTTGDVVISRAVIPYIRSRGMLFTVRGLKPNTTFTSFFDSVNVGAFTTPGSQLVVSRNTVFDSTVMAGGDSNEAGRLISGIASSSLDRGDLVFVKQRGATVYTKDTSPATAVLTMVTNPLNGTTTTLHVVNVKGTFQAADILGGSITGATATIQTSGVTIKSLGDAIVSNSSGEVSGIFNIPNTDSNRFRTGTREFKLSDDLTDNAVNRTSYARKQYVAEGVLSTTQATITSTRNADVRTEAMNENKTVVQTSERIVSDTGWYDPLAQTFLVDSVGGAFITSIDIFFASKDENIPVRMQIREVVNGYPGKNILPFSETVLNPNQVNISGTTVTTGQGEVLPAPVATNFKFPSPVYLNDKTEYCVVLVSDSNNYKVWISQLGDKSVMTTISDRIISEQPYMGVLFKSQNGSTWTGDQNQDLMFKINKAQFTTNSYGEVDFVNGRIPGLTLQNNPFYMVAGTSYVRVSHPNHGMFTDAVVVIDTGLSTGTIGGVAYTEFEGSFTIVSADIDSYIIDVGTNATYTGSFGGSAVYATENIQYNTVQPIVSQFLFPSTDLTHYIRTTTGKSTDGTETPYLIASEFSAVAINQNNSLVDLQMITTPEVESDSMAGNKSVVLRSRLITQNENVSPAIDVSRLSMITVQDRINSPLESTTNNTSLDTRNVLSANTTIAVTETNKFSTSNATAQAALLTIMVGKYITTSGFANSGNNGKFLVTEVATDGSYVKVSGTLTNESATPAITINSLERFVDEIAPLGSSALTKYITKKINLENSSTFLKVRFGADVEQAANIDLYYKIELKNSSVDFNTLAYTKATATKAAVVSDDGAFYDVEYDISNLPEFTAVQIKLVSTSTRGADIVRVRDLVIIGCA